MQKLPPFNQPVHGYAHQIEVTDISWNREFYALLMEMGTGKTKVLIDSFCGLFLTKQLNGVLILAPKGAYLNWPKNELPAHMPPEIDHYVGVWSSSMGKQDEAKCRNVIAPIDNHIDILVMNIEAINSDRAMLFAIEFLQHHDAMTIIDESDCIKNPAASRTKKALTLGRLSKYRRIATGTPITQSPLDLWSQFQFLSPGSLKFASFVAFKSFYAIQMLMRLGNRAFNVVKGFRNLETLQNDLREISYRKLKTECLDLPDKIYSTRYVEMTDEQWRIYDKFREEALIELGSSTATSTSALTTIMRLQQIACGHMRMDDKLVVDIPHNRISILEEILDEVQGKVIIWCHFKKDIENVMEFLNGARSQEHGRAVSYYGDTSDADRATNLQDFMTDPECRYLVGTPSTGGRSLTLVVSSTTVYYSNGYMLSERLQSEDRNHRIGQKNVVNVIDITATKTVDERIVKILREKKDLASLVLDCYHELLS